MLNREKYPKYHFPIPAGMTHLDFYAVAKVFSITDQCIGHALKKLLLTGVRTGGKSCVEDIVEARDTLNGWLELNAPEVLQSEAHKAAVKEQSEWTNPVRYGAPALTKEDQDLKQEIERLRRDGITTGFLQVDEPNIYAQEGTLPVGPSAPPASQKPEIPNTFSIGDRVWAKIWKGDSYESTDTERDCRITAGVGVGRFEVEELNPAQGSSGRHRVTADQLRFWVV